MMSAAAFLASVLVIAIWPFSRIAHAQETEKPDSPEVRQLLDAAKKNAGTVRRVPCQA